MSMGRRTEGSVRVSRSQLEKIILEELDRPNISEAAIDWMQGGLDIVGLVPGVGEAADGLNAAISIARNNPIEALLSGISMIPAAGDLVGKTGKSILKVLDPVMPLIKKGDDLSAVVKQIGPEELEKVAPLITQLKDTLTKFGPQIKNIFKSVKGADLEAIEKIGGFKVPDVARAKAQTLLDKASKKIDTGDIEAIFDFFANFDMEKLSTEEGTVISTEEAVTSADDASAMSSAVQKIAAGFSHPRGSYLLENNTIVGYVLGDDYINNQLHDIGVYIGALK